VDLTPDLIKTITLAASRHGEPFADSATIPAFIVSAAARNYVTVAINGDGGDEVLAGYGRYKLNRAQLFAAKAFAKFAPPYALAAMAGRFLGASTTDRAMRKVISAGPWPELNSITTYGGYYGDSDLKLLLDNLYRGEELGAWRDHWLRESFKYADNPVDRMLWFDFHTYLADGLLPKSDISAMHVGLEVRSPLLDHELVEFCSTLPPAMKIRNGSQKYLLRKVAEKFLPHDITRRSKQGFDAPITRWLLGPLKPVVDRVLNSEELLTPLNVIRVRQDVADFYGAKNHYLAPRVWALLMYGLWREQDLNC
jgi:asparagine synthase (glutamine-hydrolysing)